MEKYRISNFSLGYVYPSLSNVIETVQQSFSFWTLQIQKST